MTLEEAMAEAIRARAEFLDRLDAIATDYAGKLSLDLSHISPGFKLEFDLRAYPESNQDSEP